MTGLLALTGDAALADRLGAAAFCDSRGLTWSARAERIASVVEGRLSAKRVRHDGWRWRNARSWLTQSWLWLLHLVRHGSWVLPPDPGL